MYCKKEIEMSDRAAGQWLPYNIEDGNLHSCRNQEARTKTGTKKVDTKPLSLEDLDLRLRMVESIVIGAMK
jgi:hypothetical protein